MSNPRRSTTRSLPVILTARETQAFGERAAREVGAIGEAQDRLKEVSSQIKATIACHEAELRRVSQIVRQGYEYRHVDCEDVFDLETATVRTYRCDSGEAVDERPFTREERQGKLDL